MRGARPSISVRSWDSTLSVAPPPPVQYINTYSPAWCLGFQLFPLINVRGRGSEAKEACSLKLSHTSKHSHYQMEMVIGTIRPQLIIPPPRMPARPSSSSKKRTEGAALLPNSGEYEYAALNCAQIEIKIEFFTLQIKLFFDLHFLKHAKTMIFQRRQFLAIRTQIDFAIGSFFGFLCALVFNLGTVDSKK